MKSKIVIYDDSVILYENYIHGDKWEHVHGYARNGLTYLIQNNAIKFYIAPDYLYKNIIASMELPLYIIDEAMGIDGEYTDIDELTQILDRIFLQYNEEGIDLSLYLKKLEAEETYQPLGEYLTKESGDTFYQPIGDYLTPDDLTILDDYLTKEDAEETYQPIGDYLTKASGDTLYQPIGDYLTKASGDTIYQPIGDYLTKASGDTLYQPIGDYLTKASGDTIYQPIGNYQPAGDYALKSDIPSLDGYATQTWVQNQGYINQLKTINNISLIGEGNIQIGSGGTIDAYTKAESDERFQPKGDYVSNTTFIQYITNLTQQITSLQEALESCCSGQTGETLYRWITLTGENDYICSGTTKYAKEQKQQSTDNGATWTNVVPAEYRTGTLIETNSPDCGYEPTIEYRWVTVQGDYVCSGTTKYNKEKQQYRVDGGAWIDTDPLETRRGSTVIEYNSQDCGYIPPQYRWYQAPASDYLCSGTSKYYKEYYQVSNDGGQTWQNVTPVQTRQGALIENNSTDCGYNVLAGTVRYYTSSAGQIIDVGGCQMATLTMPNGVTVYPASDGYDGYSMPLNGWNSCTFTLVPGITTLGNIPVNTMQSAWIINMSLNGGFTKLGDDCFNGNSNMRTLELPNTLTEIGWYSFDGCTSLTSITINATTPPTFVEFAGGTTTLDTLMNANSNVVIKVPSSALNAYRTAAHWSTYSSRIQAIS